MNNKVLLPFLITTLLVGGYPRLEIAKAEQPIQIAQSIWKPFSSPEGGFTVLMPGTPIQVQNTIDTQIGALNLNGFLVERPNEAVYIVGYVEFPGNILQSAGNSNEILEGFMQGVLNSSEDRLLNQQNINLTNYPGKDFKVQKSEGVTGRYRVYLVNQRLYFLAVETPKETYLQKSIQGFLDSFQLTNVSAGSPSAPQEDLNAQLTQAVCSQNWSQAIKIIDRMIATSPSSGEVREQLINYRSRLQGFANSNAEIPREALADCASGNATSN